MPVFLKAELFQRTGSFKPRGAFTRLDALTPAERRQGVVTVSAGNHAAALAYAAARRDRLPRPHDARTASELKAAAAAGYGATLDREAEDPAALFARLDEVRGDRVLVHPFDDPLVLAGPGNRRAARCSRTAPRSTWSSFPWAVEGSSAGIAAAGGGPTRRSAYRGRRARRVRPLSAPRSRPGTPLPSAPHSLADGLNAPFAGALPLAVLPRVSASST